MEKMEKFAIRATAKSVHRRRLLLRISSVIVMVSIGLLLISYAMSNFANYAGNFTVNVNDPFSKELISLSENEKFKHPTTYLEAEALPNMDNMTEEWIPKDIEKKDGSNNGDRFIAYTFYVKNIGEGELDYVAEININSVVKNADEAVRVKVYRNGKPTTYAKRQKVSGAAEADTTPFFSQTKVMSQSYKEFKVGAIDQYTVVIWLEGKDPECVDDILGGEVNMSMNLKIKNEKKGFI